MNTNTKVDMSAAAVPARFKRAGGLGDIEQVRETSKKAK